MLRGIYFGAILALLFGSALAATDIVDRPKKQSLATGTFLVMALQR